MQYSYTHYVFQTLTYNRESGCRHSRWWGASRDCTDYIQRIRRLFKTTGRVEFLRVIERHDDWNPHIHLLLWFEHSLTVERERYFDNRFFRTLQSQWRRGYSKPEVVRDRNNAFSYVLKYFLKQLRPSTTEASSSDVYCSGIRQTSELPEKIWPLKGKRITYFGLPIRILAWSRGMPYLYQAEQLRRKPYLRDSTKILVSNAKNSRLEIPLTCG